MNRSIKISMNTYVHTLEVEQLRNVFGRKGTLNIICILFNHHVVIPTACDSQVVFE